MRQNLPCNFVSFSLSLKNFVKRMFSSIPGVILYTFLHFDSTPAIVSSVVIGLGIVFCGAAVVHNVFVWQKVRLHHSITVKPGFSHTTYIYIPKLDLNKGSLKKIQDLLLEITRTPILKVPSRIPQSADI